MKKFFSSMTLIVAVLLSASFSFSATPAPDFSSWRCRGEMAEDPRMFRVTCFDKESIDIADSMVVRYSDEVNLTKGDLLIWFAFERSKNIFSIPNKVKVYRIDKYKINFYRTNRNQDGILDWVWLETKELDRASFNEGQKILIADVNSLFGKEYFAFMKRMGRDPAKINMPSIRFDREKN